MLRVEAQNGFNEDYQALEEKCLSNPKKRLAEGYSGKIWKIVKYLSQIWNFRFL